MISTLKTSLLVFWIFYIVFVSGVDEGEERLKRKYIHYCKAIIEKIYKNDTRPYGNEPIDFFEFGFKELNINSIQTMDDEPVRTLIMEYFQHQLEKAEEKTQGDIEDGYAENYILSGFWTPYEYCDNEQSNFKNTCLAAMTSMNFTSNMSGAEVFRTFYHDYIYDDITINTIFPLWRSNASAYGPFYVREGDTLEHRVCIIKSYMNYMARRFRSVEQDDMNRFSIPHQFCVNKFNKKKYEILNSNFGVWNLNIN